MSNIELKELMLTSPSSLAEVQLKSLKAHVIAVLKSAIKDINENRFIANSIPISHSPAGDGYGCENNFIDFGYDVNEMDISEALCELDRLKNQQ